MRVLFAGPSIFTLVIACATAQAAGLPPGRQHRLTIRGENTVTFVPELNLPDVKVEYTAKVEYIVDSRYGKDPKPTSTEGDEKDQDKPTEKAVARSTSSTTKSNSKAKKAESPASKPTGAIDVSLHSIERVFRQNGQPILEMKVSRSKFQGRPQPEMPIFNVASANAPLPLQEIMKGFDVIVASLLLDDNLKVVNRKYFRAEGPQRALTETILSIHTPLPRNADSWEAPTQLLMGHGQTAKGILRFEKLKPVVLKDDKAKEPEKDKEKPKGSTLVKVKATRTLKAEGVIAGRFIKGGTFDVTGEQTFDTRTHDWVTSRWSVVVDNELANPNGQVVARAKGTMLVESKALEIASPASPGESDKADLKP